MKYVRIWTLFLFALCSPAAAQWQVPDGTTPIGRGTGKTGFGNSSVATITATGAVPGLGRTFLCDATSASVAISLPVAASVANGASVTVTRKDANAHNCSAVVTGGGAIEGQPVWPIEPQYTSFTFVSDGATWWVQ